MQSSLPHGWVLILTMPIHSLIVQFQTGSETISVSTTNEKYNAWTFYDIIPNLHDISLSYLEFKAHCLIIINFNRLEVLQHGFQLFLNIYSRVFDATKIIRNFISKSRSN